MFYAGVPASRLADIPGPFYRGQKNSTGTAYYEQKYQNSEH